MAVDERTEERSLQEDLAPGQERGQQEAARPEEAGLPFPCPECPRRFKNRQGLARHRSVAHGVKGQSRGGRKRKKTTTARPRSGSAAAAGFQPAALNRVRLLGMVAPSASVPIDMVGRVSRWLDEAEVIHAALTIEAPPKKKRRPRKRKNGPSTNGAGG